MPTPGMMPGPAGMPGARPAPGVMPGPAAPMAGTPRPTPGFMPGPGTGDAAAPPPSSPNAPPAAGPASSPGLMPSPAPQTPPMAGGIPKMAGDMQHPAAPNNQESGERNRAGQSLPHFPRNRFGAMLMPQGQINPSGQQSMAPNPGAGGAFNMQNLMQNFLQRTPSTMAPGPSGLA